MGMHDLLPGAGNGQRNERVRVWMGLMKWAVDWLTPGKKTPSWFEISSWRERRVLITLAVNVLGGVLTFCGFGIEIWLFLGVWGVVVAWLLRTQPSAWFVVVPAAYWTIVTVAQSVGAVDVRDVVIGAVVFFVGVVLRTRYKMTIGERLWSAFPHYLVAFPLLFLFFLQCLRQDREVTGIVVWLVVASWIYFAQVPDELRNKGLSAAPVGMKGMRRKRFGRRTKGKFKKGWRYV